MSMRVASKANAPVLFCWLVALFACLTVCGCTPNASDTESGTETGTETPSSGASTDPTVTLITIGADLTVSPLSPTISKSGNGGVQWHNDGTEPATLTLVNAPVSLEIAPGAYSTVHRLTENVSQGQTIDYTVKRGPSGPPDPPSFEVGP